jgi:hypothetical protein
MTIDLTGRTLASATSRHPRPGAVTRYVSRPGLGFDRTGVRAWLGARGRSAAASCRGGAGASPACLRRARGGTRITRTRAALALTGASAPRTRSARRTCTGHVPARPAGTPPGRCRRLTGRCGRVTGRCLPRSLRLAASVPGQAAGPARVQDAGRRPPPGTAGSCRSGQQPAKARPARRHRSRRLARRPDLAGDGTAGRVSASPWRGTLLCGVHRGEEPGLPSAGGRASPCRGPAWAR